MASQTISKVLPVKEWAVQTKVSTLCFIKVKDVQQLPSTVLKAVRPQEKSIANSKFSPIEATHSPRLSWPPAQEVQNLQ